MLSLRPETIALLNDIESRIDPETEEDLAAQWKAFLYGESKEDIFHPRRKKTSPSGMPIPNININDALAELKADGTIDKIVAQYISAE